MTRRLYEEDAYLRQFDGLVLECRQAEGGFAILLNQSCFYPEGGGQPGDRGQFQAGGQVLRVMDTQVDQAGDIWHHCDGQLEPGSAVRGQIDWARRFDHMQQHAGEHILAGCLWQLAHGYTHGLHIGASFSSIDASLPDGQTRLGAEVLAAVELLANERVQQDAPITAWYPGDDRLASLPLRKAPSVSQQVRVVKAGDFEMVACAGTHPSSTGQVGIIKVLGQEPARGKLRLRFVCGMRAVRHYQRSLEAAQAASALLSSPLEDLPLAVERLKAQQASQAAQLKDMEKQLLLDRQQDLLDSASPLSGGGRLVVAQLPGHNREAMVALGQALIAKPGTVALLQCQGADGSYSLLFGRHQAAPGDMGALMRQAGAKGGGRPDFAQGSAKDCQALERARQLYMEAE